MTDRTLSLPTQSVTSSQTAVLSPKSTPTLPNYVSNKAQGAIEEEPYTIKCICNFTDDDGNTIYCETCDTWQHIECYYPLNIDEALREDFAHSCVECKPRPLDRQGAYERQRLRRSKPSTAEASERKVKRPPTKTTKKKTKPTDPGLNGQISLDLHSKYPQDHPPIHQHRKSKSTHRSSQSISSQNPKRSPSYGQKTGNPHGHPPSPATTPPDFPHELEAQYSNAFLNLYKDDRDVLIVRTNSFASLLISNVLSSWPRDHEKLRVETGCQFDDVFRPLPPDIESLKISPRVESRKLSVGPDTVVQWQHLRMSETIEKDVPLMELNGQIGIQKEYCQDPENRWQELSTPLPFVFFHPLLPIYIDTRKEGSFARYVRRSCKPNAVLDTYLSDGSEYHFWLVSDRRILPGEQVTIPWEFNLQKDVAKRWEQLLGLGDEEAGAQPEYDEKETETYQSIASWVHAVLSEYGGCACDLGADCAFARFHRTYIFKPQQQAKETKVTKKKSRKTKTNAVSPTSTGHATNSRAPSEGHGDDGVDNDSGSSRSKPPSRDMTPAPRQGSFDTLGVLTELTDRDKRKVQMVEDSFRRMEQQQQPPRKKKRTSDGSSNSTTKPKPRGSFSHPGGLPNGVSERRYVDAGTSRSISGSPSSGVSPSTVSHFKHNDSRRLSTRALARRSSQGVRPEYCDVSVQTDPVDGEWFSGDGQTPKPKRRVVSLSKRLLESRHRLRADEERKRKAQSASPFSVTSAIVKMDLDSLAAEHNLTTAVPEVSEVKQLDKPTPPQLDSSTDIPMEDAPVSPTDVKNSLAATPAVPKSIKNKSPELRVQMPPVPAFNGTILPNVTTPLSASGTPAQSPFSGHNLPSPFTPASVNGVAVHPSPIKKKLSLSDYTKSRMNKAAAAKPVGTSLKPPSTVLEEAKSPTSSDITVLETPVTDKSVE
ncbi:hypothetical protein F4811DRAFT_571398 [Daldinia bambusicola]|nr:hypothetical protein F4811DRAFT_571398 [Daldinia bambusicola]